MGHLATGSSNLALVSAFRPWRGAIRILSSLLLLGAPKPATCSPWLQEWTNSLMLIDEAEVQDSWIFEWCRSPWACILQYSAVWEQLESSRLVLEGPRMGLLPLTKMSSLSAPHSLVYVRSHLGTFFSWELCKVPAHRAPLAIKGVFGGMLQWGRQDSDRHGPLGGLESNPICVFSSLCDIGWVTWPLWASLPWFSKWVCTSLYHWFLPALGIWRPYVCLPGISKILSNSDHVKSLILKREKEERREAGRQAFVLLERWHHTMGRSILSKGRFLVLLSLEAQSLDTHLCFRR